MPRNVIFILADEHRWDAVGWENPLVRTPNLDRLAARGVRFNNCFCAAQACVPSRANILTGRYNEEAGMVSNDTILGRHERTWPGHLDEHGWQTVAVGRTHHIDKGFGSVIRVPSGRSYPMNCHDDKMQAFWREDAYVGPSDASFEDYYETAITSTALGFLREMHRGEEPFALYVGYLAPHGALTPPEPYWSMYEGLDIPMPEDTLSPQDIIENWSKRLGFEGVTQDRYNRIVRGYYGMISTVDACVGMILDEVDRLGIAEDTMIVYTSDHGEMLGDKGLYVKGYGYEPSIGVPLLVSCPGTLPEGAVSDALIELTDIGPTIIEALDAPPMPCSGKSALSVFKGDSDKHRDWIYSSLGCGQVCRNEGYKWIHRRVDGKCVDEVYDMSADPRENNNIADTPEGREVMLKFYPDLLDFLSAHWHRPVTDFDPEAVQPRLIPFFTT
ncbi:MAG: sulfatase-like hydrolase/transferase [Armatimonadota bacterium]|nr:sulfatase-like hydrolase/transferase [bacterium]